MGSACIFCDIVAGKASASVVYADDQVMALMDIGPVNPGHVLVITREHYAYLDEVPETLWAHLCMVTQRVAQAVRSSGVRCEGVNLFLADGEAAFQEIFHCHVHVFPRFRGDQFRIEADWSQKPPRQELDTIAQQIATGYRREFP